MGGAVRFCFFMFFLRGPWWPRCPPSYLDRQLYPGSPHSVLTWYRPMPSSLESIEYSRLNGSRNFWVYGRDLKDRRTGLAHPRGGESPLRLGTAHSSHTTTTALLPNHTKRTPNTQLAHHTKRRCPTKWCHTKPATGHNMFFCFDRVQLQC